MYDVFKDGTDAEVGFWERKEIGAKIQGTYIERVELPAKGIYGAQIGYKLKTDTGVKIAAFTLNKHFIHDGMKQAKLGQIVGFLYEGDYETEASKRDPNISPSHTIKVKLGEMDKTYQVEDLFPEAAEAAEGIPVDEVPFK